MPIYNLNNEINDITEDKENTSIYPTYETDRADKDVITYLPGYRWNVTYFHRITDSSTIVTTYDPNLDITLQDLIRINEFVIYVDNPLSTGSGEDLSGSGIIDVDFVPVPNDIFLTKISDGRELIFSIVNVERISYNNKDVYHISYKLYTELTSVNDPILKNIVDSVVEEYYYNKDYRVKNEAPLYTLDKIKERQNIYSYLDKLINYWVDTYLTTDTNFYVGYEEDNIFIYDPYMEKFIIDVIGIRNIKNIEPLLDYKKNVSILDIIVDPTVSKKQINLFLEVIPVTTYGTNPYLFSLAYTGIEHILDLKKETYLDSNESILNTYFPNVDKKCYIFREHIYKHIIDQEYDNTIINTLFEKLFLDMMSGNVLKYGDITEIYNNIYNLPYKEGFYFIPIYIYILRYYITTFTVNFI